MISERRYESKDCAVFFKTKEAFGGLSNMAAGYPIQIGPWQARTSEALYQAMKFPAYPAVQKAILGAKSPIEAKKISRQYGEMARKDWDHCRISVMRWSIRAKLTMNWESFGEALRETGSKPIVELSYKDTFWGAKPTQPGVLVGKNALGRLLMQLRMELLGPRPQDLHKVEPVVVENFTFMGMPMPILYGGPDKAPAAPRTSSKETHQVDFDFG